MVAVTILYHSKNYNFDIFCDLRCITIIIIIAEETAYMHLHKTPIYTHHYSFQKIVVVSF